MLMKFTYSWSHMHGLVIHNTDSTHKLSGILDVVITDADIVARTACVSLMLACMTIIYSNGQLILIVRLNLQSKFALGHCFSWITNVGALAVHFAVLPVGRLAD